MHRNCVSLALLVAVVMSLGCAEDPGWGSAPQGLPGAPDIQVVGSIGHITTLYLLDPFAESLNLRNGAFGGVIRDRLLMNGWNDLQFSTRETHDSLATASGSIIDVGSTRELARRYGFAEWKNDGPVGPNHAYPSIHRRGEGLVILQHYNRREFQSLIEANQLFQETEGSGAARAVLGHVYILRSTLPDPETGRDAPIIAKLLVIAYEPGVSITLRWQVLPDLDSAGE